MSAEMINNHKKVVFLDVDGTMVNDRGEIPESTKEAVRRAKANGHKMVVCTGRSRFQIYDELLELGFSGIVGAAGVFVIADGKEIYHAYIDEEHRKSVYDYLEGNGFLFCYQADDGVVLNRRSSEGILEIYRKMGMSEERLVRLTGNMHLTEEPGRIREMKSFYIIMRRFRWRRYMQIWSLTLTRWRSAWKVWENMRARSASTESIRQPAWSDI